METWQEVESAASSLILSHNIELKLDQGTPFKNIEKILTDHDLVKASQLRIYSDLRILRNKVAHAPQYDISSQQAREYVDLGLSLQNIFHRKGKILANMTEKSCISSLNDYITAKVIKLAIPTLSKIG